MKLRVTLGQAGLITLLIASATPAFAQSFRVQCPTSTITHPVIPQNINAEPRLYRPDTLAVNGQWLFGADRECEWRDQMPAGIGRRRLLDHGERRADVHVSFGPLSGLADIANGLPGTQFPSVFNMPYPRDSHCPGDPATTDGIVANTWPALSGRRPSRPRGSRITAPSDWLPTSRIWSRIYDIARTRRDQRRRQGDGAIKLSSRPACRRQRDHRRDRDRL